MKMRRIRISLYWLLVFLALLMSLHLHGHHHHQIQVEASAQTPPDARLAGFAVPFTARSDSTNTSPGGAMMVLPTSSSWNSNSELLHRHPANDTGTTSHRTCRNNAIVYLAKGYGLLNKSLDLLYDNYLTRNQQYKNATLFIFHTGEFNETTDLRDLEHHRPHETWGTLRLVNVHGYWKVPKWLLRRRHDIQRLVRKKLTQYPIGYHHMIRWYTLGLWEYLETLNVREGCQYRYIMRLDEESFIHSPIDYDVFHFMAQHGYRYGFRACSYEMQSMRSFWLGYLTATPELSYMRDNSTLQNGKLKYVCGFYNNWAVADLNFFRSEPVQHFLNWVDRDGSIYSHRLGDLQIQTAAVYAFLPISQIYRFTDFTYEHWSRDKDSQCPFYGCLLAGHNDVVNGNKLVEAFMDAELAQRNCPTMAQARSQEWKPRLAKFQSTNFAREASANYTHSFPTGVQTLGLTAGMVEYWTTIESTIKIFEPHVDNESTPVYMPIAKSKTSPNNTIIDRNYKSPEWVYGSGVHVKIDPVFGKHRSEADAVFALATDYSLSDLIPFVQSLLNTGYAGDVVLGLSPNMPDDLSAFVEYHSKYSHLVVYEVKLKCKFARRIRCTVSNMFWRDGVHLADVRPLREKAQLRFEFYWAWTLHYSSDSRIFLLDARDTFFQLDPFPLLESTMHTTLHVFEEWEGKSIRQERYNALWIQSSRGDEWLEKIGDRNIVCSGTTVGGQPAIETYTRAIVSQWDDTLCIVYGCDQGHHNFLIHGHFLEGAPNLTTVVIHKQGTGVANTVGQIPETTGFSLRQHGLVDNTTDQVLNTDGTPSPIVHQFDRDEEMKNIIMVAGVQAYLLEWNRTVTGSKP